MLMKNTLREGRWWDDSPTVTVYHGTSSALLPDIQQHGLRPPHDIREFAMKVLHGYVSPDKVTPKIIDTLIVTGIQYRTDMWKDSHGSIFGFPAPHYDRAAGYAISYAEHGGELAYDVWRALTTKLRMKPVPRFKGADPVVLALEVPKTWVKYPFKPDELKARLDKIWAERETIGTLARGMSSIDELYDDAGEQEAWVMHTVPWEMITVMPVSNADRKRLKYMGATN